MNTFAFAARPPTGTKGQPCIVGTNCFKLSKLRQGVPLAFNHYQTIFLISRNKEIKGASDRREIIKKLYINDRPEAFQPGHTVYDGRAALFATKDLGQDVVFEINRFHDSRPQDPPNVRIQLRKVAYVSESEFDHLLQGQGSPGHPIINTITAQQVLNLLLHNATPPDFRRVTSRTSLFSISGKQDLGLGQELWLGCFANVRPAKDHLLLNVDVSAVVMYMSDRLPNVAMALLGLRDPRGVRNPVHLSFLESRLRNLRVRQVEAGKIGRRLKVKRLIQNAGEYTFPTRDGTLITVKEYYLNTYNYRLRYPDLPGILIVKKDQNGKPSDNKDVIPFELLELVEGQFYKRTLDAAVQVKVQKLTTTSPEERRNKIYQYLPSFSAQALALCGLYLNKDFLQIRGRIIPPPSIKIKQRTIEPDKGEWRMSSRSSTHFLTPCTIESWSVTSYERSVDDEFCQDLLNNLMIHMSGFGIDTRYLAHQRLCIHNNLQGNVKEHFELLTSKLNKLFVPKSEKEIKKSHLALVILPPNSGDGYEQIKRACDTTAGPGMITQLLSMDKLKGLKNAYLSNVVLKINERMGGTNFVPVGNGMEGLSSAPFMVVGLDVSHPSPGIIRPSMAGMVYSVDQYASTYFAKCYPQAPRLEFIESLSSMMLNALKAFATRNEKPPKLLFVYRDGVSEGELDRVCPEEIRAIEAAINEVWHGAPTEIERHKILLTYIVVGKRHHIRFFPEKGRGDRTGNCPSGFVTDSDQIANPRIFDYFLQSHAGLLGTSRPAHYMVIRDDCRATADQLQGLSFSLCHTFARSTRAVSIPAPVYYAHLVCKRSNIHIQYRFDGPVPSMDGSHQAEFNVKDWDFFNIHPLHAQLKYFI